MEWIEQEYMRRRGLKPAHWFDADSMRFFRSRIVGVSSMAQTLRQKGTQRIVFMTSEQNHSVLTDHTYPRRYSVRIMDHRGNINTVGPFCELTRSEARKLAKQIANRKPVDGFDLAGRRIHA